MVVAGPRTPDLLPQEVDALEQYLGKAGKVFLLPLDPPEKVDSPPLTEPACAGPQLGCRGGF